MKNYGDVIEDGVNDLELDEGAAVDRKKHIAAHKKMYKKHYKIRGILIAYYFSTSQRVLEDE